LVERLLANVSANKLRRNRIAHMGIVTFRLCPMVCFSMNRSGQSSMSQSASSGPLPASSLLVESPATAAP
jgi:hypothetical protein